MPFLDYDVEIRKVICSTNAIESINARYRRAVRVRGHFPNEQAALKCLYLTTRSLDPTGNGKARWATRWKPALNAFAITFEGRIPNKMITDQIRSTVCLIDPQRSSNGDRSFPRYTTTDLARSDVLRVGRSTVKEKP